MNAWVLVQCVLYSSSRVAGDQAKQDLPLKSRVESVKVGESVYFEAGALPSPFTVNHLLFLKAEGKAQVIQSQRATY